MHLPLLRATCANLWFGGGSIISWREVEAIYELFKPRNGSPTTRRDHVSLRRRRNLLQTR
jgi:hypothetical protein